VDIAERNASVEGAIATVKGLRCVRQCELAVMDRDDAEQEALLCLLDNVHKMDRSRDSVNGFVVTVARNGVYDAVKRYTNRKTKNPRLPIHVDSLANVPSHAKEVGDELSPDYMWEVIRPLTRRLTRQQREIVRLKVYGKDYGEIARAGGILERTVLVRFSEGVAAIRRQAEERGVYIDDIL